MEIPVLRIHLSGPVTLEAGDLLLGPREFPGRQGVIAFVVLVGEGRRPVARSELADVLWSGRPPPSWSTALSAIVSKLRSLLGRAGLDGSAALVSSGGCYELRLPAGTWIDHEVAADQVHEAEAALEAGEPARAYGPSAVAHHIARRPFLPGEDGHWIERRRETIGHVLVRALECRARVYLWNGEHPLAVEAARELVELRPFRESGYRLLMRAHAAAGNAAEALRVYERCRALISDELGVSPSDETKTVHSEVLEST